MKKTNRRNGPVVTYRFNSSEEMAQFDAGKLTLEEAAYKVRQYHQLMTHEVQELSRRFPIYVYPGQVKRWAVRFLVVDLKYKEVFYHKYMQLDKLRGYMNTRHLQVYLINYTKEEVDDE